MQRGDDRPLKLEVRSMSNNNVPMRGEIYLSNQREFLFRVYAAKLGCEKAEGEGSDDL